MKRAITIGYVVESPEIGEFWKRLHRAWNQCQRANNAAVRAFMLGDDAPIVVNSKGRETLAKLSSVNAYEAARQAAPELSSSPCADIAQRVRGKYLSDRYAIRVRHAKSVSTFRGPQPLPIRTKDWQFSENDGEFRATFPLCDLLRDERPVIRFIPRGHDDRRMLSMIASGEWKRCTIELLCPGWDRRGSLKAKIVYERPATNRKPPTRGAMRVQTGADCLLHSGDFRWHAEQLRARIARYEASRHRVAEDWKHEQRLTKKRRFVKRREVGIMADKHARRVETCLHQIALQVVNYARRGGFAAIEYDDSERRFAPLFPWHQLKEYMRQKCEVAGIEMKEVELATQ